MQSILIENGEQLDEVNYRIRLIQKKDGLRFGTDALLLAAYMQSKERARAVELGGGSGIISLLCLAKEKFREIECVEIQPAYTELIARNASLNNYADRLHACCCDVRDYAQNGMKRQTADIAFCNPPYMHTGGAANENEEKNIARHEIHGTISDFCAAAARVLRFAGRFYCVYRTDRLIDLIDAMREVKLEPKRMTFVHATENASPSMVLVEGLSGGKPGLRVTRPLILYKSGTQEYTTDMECVMSNGYLPQSKE
ncbi:MAG: methyltransferase [Clostridia bacterium]|nr:methyltransferase [Clostridia bacterium]